MRLSWLPICCILTGMTQAHADSYRDRDDGFNPLNVMQGMPNPMNMFDSSDRRRDERLRRPPPPGVVPGYGYPGYGLPAPAPMAPYYTAPPPSLRCRPCHRTRVSPVIRRHQQATGTSRGRPLRHDGTTGLREDPGQAIRHA